MFKKIRTKLFNAKSKKKIFKDTLIIFKSITNNLKAGFQIEIKKIDDYVLISSKDGKKTTENIILQK
jgi:hypothetical protein